MRTKHEALGIIFVALGAAIGLILGDGIWMKLAFAVIDAAAMLGIFAMGYALIRKDGRMFACGAGVATAMSLLTAVVVSIA